MRTITDIAAFINSNICIKFFQIMIIHPIII